MQPLTLHKNVIRLIVQNLLPQPYQIIAFTHWNSKLHACIFLVTYIMLQITRIWEVLSECFVACRSNICVGLLVFFTLSSCPLTILTETQYHPLLLLVYFAWSLLSLNVGLKQPVIHCFIYIAFPGVPYLIVYLCSDCPTNSSYYSTHIL